MKEGQGKRGDLDGDLDGACSVIWKKSQVFIRPLGLVLYSYWVVLLRNTLKVRSGGTGYEYAWHSALTPPTR